MKTKSPSCPSGGVHMYASWENLFILYVNNKGADQPAHPRSLISAFVVRCLDSMIPLPVVSISEISSLHLVYVAAQAGLSYLVANPEDRFSHDVAHMASCLFQTIQLKYCHYVSVWWNLIQIPTSTWQTAVTVNTTLSVTIVSFPDSQK